MENFGRTYYFKTSTIPRWPAMMYRPEIIGCCCCMSCLSVSPPVTCFWIDRRLGPTAIISPGFSTCLYGEEGISEKLKSILRVLSAAMANFVSSVLMVLSTDTFYERTQPACSSRHQIHENAKRNYDIDNRLIELRLFSWKSTKLVLGPPMPTTFRN